MNNAIALTLFIEAMLPICIAQYQRKGITDTDIERARSLADELACHGDTLQYGGKPGEAGRLAGQLVDAMAILTLSASPGSIGTIERWLQDAANSAGRAG